MNIYSCSKLPSGHARLPHACSPVDVWQSRRTEGSSSVTGQMDSVIYWQGEISHQHLRGIIYWSTQKTSLRYIINTIIISLILTAVRTRTLHQVCLSVLILLKGSITSTDRLLPVGGTKLLPASPLNFDTGYRVTSINWWCQRHPAGVLQYITNDVFWLISLLMSPLAVTDWCPTLAVKSTAAPRFSRSVATLTFP